MDTALQERRPLPLCTPETIVMTRGVHDFVFEIDTDLSFFSFFRALAAAFESQPDVCMDGGNDKYFFSFTWGGKKIWAVANEITSLTAMFPDEY